jgi:HTH-type transcriptional regulator, competence development regulator
MCCTKNMQFLKKVSQTFGKCIKDARRSKGYSQRDLAAKVGVDYTYLSKLENDRADYPPKDEVIRSLIEHLDLEIDLANLSYLAGRITPEDSKVIQQLAKTYQDKMPVLLRKMQDPAAMRQLLESEDDHH